VLRLALEERARGVAGVDLREAAAVIANAHELGRELRERPPGPPRAQPKVVVLGTVEVAPAADRAQRIRPDRHGRVRERRLDEQVVHDLVVRQRGVQPRLVRPLVLRDLAEEADAARHDVGRGMALQVVRLRGEAALIHHVVRVDSRDERGRRICQPVVQRRDEAAGGQAPHDEPRIVPRDRLGNGRGVVGGSVVEHEAAEVGERLAPDAVERFLDRGRGVTDGQQDVDRAQSSFHRGVDR
jgi:hypothetical protein